MYGKRDETRSSQNFNPLSLTLLDSKLVKRLYQIQRSFSFLLCSNLTIDSMEHLNLSVMQEFAQMRIPQLGWIFWQMICSFVPLRERFHNWDCIPQGNRQARVIEEIADNATEYYGHSILNLFVWILSLNEWERRLLYFVCQSLPTKFATCF